MGQGEHHPEQQQRQRHARAQDRVAVGQRLPRRRMQGLEIDLPAPSVDIQHRTVVQFRRRPLLVQGVLVEQPAAVQVLAKIEDPDRLPPGVDLPHAIDQRLRAERGVDPAGEGRAPRRFAGRLQAVGVDRRVHQQPVAPRPGLHQLHRRGEPDLAAVAGLGHGPVAMGLGEHVEADGQAVGRRLRLQQQDRSIDLARALRPDLEQPLALVAHGQLQRFEVAAAQVGRVAQALHAGELSRQVEPADVVVPLSLRGARHRPVQRHAAAQGQLVMQQPLAQLVHDLVAFGDEAAVPRGPLALVRLVGVVPDQQQRTDQGQHRQHVAPPHPRTAAAGRSDGLRHGLRHAHSIPARLNGCRARSLRALRAPPPPLY